MVPTRRSAATARFDTLALRPPEPTPADGPAAAGAAPIWPALTGWCGQDAAGLPQALLHGPGADVVAEAMACRIDGSQRLAGLGRAAGLAWRLSLKLREALGWRRPHDPWDAGWVLTTANGRAQLGQHWWPRRPTLLLAAVADADVLAPVQQALAARLATRASGDGAGRPLAVRWVWIDPASAAAACAATAGPTRPGFLPGRGPSAQPAPADRRCSAPP